MEIIALEEHFRNAAIEKAIENMIPPGLSDLLYGPGSHLQEEGTDRLKQDVVFRHT